MNELSTRARVYFRDKIYNHPYAFLIFWMPVFLLIFIVFIVAASEFFGMQKVNLWLYKRNKWFEASTKINYMQSVFQLGAATSAAFAIAGPQIQHALGPRVQKSIQHARLALRKPDPPVIALRHLIQSLQRYDRHKRDDAALRRSRLYPFHLSIALLNIFLLIWSSVIDPRGEIQDIYAIILMFICIFAPFSELRDTFLEARHIRPIIQKANNACDSRISERIEAAKDAIEAEIKPFPVTN